MTSQLHKEQSGSYSVYDDVSDVSTFVAPSEGEEDDGAYLVRFSEAEECSCQLLEKIDLKGDPERKGEKCCTVGDFMSFVFFLLLLLGVDNLVKPDSFLCGCFSILFSGLFMSMRSYSNARAFTLISMINGFGVSCIGAMNYLRFNDQVVELYESGMLNNAEYSKVEEVLFEGYRRHLLLLVVFVILLGVEFILERFEDRGKALELFDEGIEGTCQMV